MFVPAPKLENIPGWGKNILRSINENWGGGGKEIKKKIKIKKS